MPVLLKNPTFGNKQNVLNYLEKKRQREDEERKRQEEAKLKQVKTEEAKKKFEEQKKQTEAERKPFGKQSPSRYVAPEAFKTLSKVGAGIQEITKAVVQGTLRNVASATLTVSGAMGGPREVKLDPKVTVNKLLFGQPEEPLRAIENRIAQGELKSRDVGRAIKKGDILTFLSEGKKQAIGNLLEKEAFPISALLVTGDVFADLIPGGGSSKVFKQLAKTDNVVDVVKILKKTKMPEKVIREISPIIATEKSAKNVEQIIRQAQKNLPRKVYGLNGLEAEINPPPNEVPFKTQGQKAYDKILEESPFDYSKTIRDQEDLGSLRDFSDLVYDKEFDKYIRQTAGEEFAERIVLDAKDIAQRYGINPNQSDKTLARIFSEIFEADGKIPDKYRTLIPKRKIAGKPEYLKDEITGKFQGSRPTTKDVLDSQAGFIRPGEFLESGKRLFRKLKGDQVESSEQLEQKLFKVTRGKERKYITSAKEAIPEATKIAGQYIPRSTDKLSMKAANLIKDDIKSAEKIAMQGTDEKAVATASELLKHYAKKASEADETVKTALYDKAAEIANNMAPKLTELGRSVQAAAILGRLTPEGQVRFAAKQIIKWNADHPARKIPELTAKQAGKILEEMKVIENMADGTEKAKRFMALQNYINDLIPSSLVEKVTSIWKAGLLTGIKTSGLNIFSNLTHAGMEVAKDVPAAAADKLLSLLTGKRTVVASAKGLPSGLKEGAQKGWDYLKTGYDARNIAKKLDYHKINFKNKKIQGYVDTVFRILGSEDQPFYYGALNRSLYNQAKAQAKTQKLTGKKAREFINNLIENPTEEMSVYAVADAETAVFQNQTTLGKIGTAVQRAPLGELVVPFARTPSAVAMQVLNYSPVGPVLEVARQIKKGAFDQRSLSQAIGRGATGTVPIYLGMVLFDNNKLSLDTPKTESERELWKAEGRQANSIKIGDKWRTVQTLGPAGPLLLMGGHFKQALENKGSQTEAIIDATFGTIKSFTEQTFLRGVNDVIGAISEPEKQGKYAVSNFVSSWIPTIISDIARAKDPKERRTETVLQRVQSRIPALREKLEPQVTTLGEERVRGGNVLETILDPTRPSKDISAEVTNELRRLTDSGYKVAPTLLGDKAGYKALNAKENTKLWETAGNITNQKLTNLFKLEEYQELNDEEKSKMVEKVIDFAKVNSRAVMALEKTEGLEGDDLRSKLRELRDGGLLNQEVLERYMDIR